MTQREIKFRVWDNVDYMSSPFTLQDIQDKKIQFTSDCHVMQFTGLLDKNGKECYEGDIVVYWNGEKGSIWNDGVQFMYAIGHRFRAINKPMTKVNEVFEIIGNIYSPIKP